MSWAARSAGQHCNVDMTGHSGTLYTLDIQLEGLILQTACTHLVDVVGDGNLAGSRVHQGHGGSIGLKALWAGTYKLEVVPDRQPDPGVRDIVAIADIHHLHIEQTHLKDK